MSDAHCSNLTQRKALGLVTHDNTGGPFVVECHGCGSVYPSYQCFGGGQIADTGDYDDARCPHCEQVDPEECGNVGLAWNIQQLKINELQKRLTAADERIDERGGTCTWNREDDRSSWNSACGTTWTFNDDGPEENGMRFCHSCGKTLVVESAESA